ncbi:MAG: helix-turn-helix transcriptional regulator, partial [Pseudomonadota bacterium]
DVAPNALSPHLAALTRAGLANVERRGRSLIYTASIDGVNSLVAALVDDCCNGHPDVCQALETSKSLAC